MKAILLVRVSSIQQQLDEQTSNLVTYAGTKGYLFDDLIIIEDSESAINLPEEERNGLNKMKAAIADDNSINAIFIWELSRLTRKPTTAFSLRDYFNTNHIQLYCYSPQFQLLKSDLSDLDDNGSLLYALYVQMAEAEMRNKKERFHRSKIRNARTGKYSGGFVKYGYSVNALGFYEINEEQAELVRYIFNEYEKGISMMKLMKELIQRGKVNTQNFVREILTSQAFTGVSDKYGMNRTYPQIVSVEQFEKCRQIAKENNKKLDKAAEIYFCKKLIKCVECGTHYIGMKSSTMYLCYGRYGKEAKLYPDSACKNSPFININLLDSLVWNIAKELDVFWSDLGIKNELKLLQEQIGTNIEIINNSICQINKVAKKREKNNYIFENDQRSLEKYKSIATAYDQEVKEYNNLIVKCKNENEQMSIKIQTAEKKDELLDLLNDRAEYLESVTDEEKQLIVQRHIKEINILEDVPQKTKIILIHFFSGETKRYRAHICTKPPNVEFDTTYMYGGQLPTIWSPYWPFEIEKRFTRCKVSKTKK